MEFRIADTFTDSLARLTADEQKAVKTTAFDLQLDPASPGMAFHKLDKARDKNFWSVRVSNDIRLIVHKTDGSLLLCYTDHHDRAYAWAERRKLETHPKTGAAQLVEIRETVQEVLIPSYTVAEAVGTKLPLFASHSDEELLNYGVPMEWLPDVRRANEDSLLTLADRLPAEAGEALLELATGGRPRLERSVRARMMPSDQPNKVLASYETPAGTNSEFDYLNEESVSYEMADSIDLDSAADQRSRMVQPITPKTSPFDHPDAQRRFRLITNIEELQRALEFPWDKWTVFLHPAQRQIVEREYNGPARISGSAGTGKTIVALHRAVFVTRANPDARVLLTTFSDILANSLRTKLRRLISNEPRLAERLEVQSINAIGARLYRSHSGQANLASREVITELLREVSKDGGNHKFSLPFLLTEWEQVVDAWQLETWESYRDVVRLGRKTRLPEPQRTVLWSVFERVRAGLVSGNMITLSSMFTTLAATVAQGKNRPFDFVVIDEAQDISVAHLRFFAALGGLRPDALFFAGDLGQRIFQQPFSWLSLGVDIRGRSRTLRVNYRTSHQIRMQADRLLGPEVSDADGNREERSHTVSVFNGPVPDILVLDSEDEEVTRVAEWISERAKEGIMPHEFGVFVRSTAELDRASAAVKQSGITYRLLDENVETISGHACICTMHLAKGLEFRAVAVMACDDEIIPLQERIETVGDEADLQEVYDTERHLLYVACTRARDHLLVTGVAPASEFLDDLRG